jgi:hypothetical protein
MELWIAILNKLLNAFITNTKLKLLNCNANTYFNITCLEQNMIPKYAHIKVNSHKKSIVEHTESKIQKIRIKNETNFGTPKKI